MNTNRLIVLPAVVLLVGAAIFVGCSGGAPNDILKGVSTLSSAQSVSILPSSAIAVLTQGTSVTLYVPNGAWDGGTTGVEVVPIEPTPVGTASTIATPNVANSCAANSVTGQVVCVANNTDVYLINGTKLTTTLTSGSSALTGFTGGDCNNCGVTINAVTNQAVISMGLTATSGNSNSGFQFVNLANNTLSTPFNAANEVSEDPQVDPTRNLLLSPNENGVYALYKISGTSLTEFKNAIGGGDLDSAAEDTTTGIALSADEFTSNVYIADLTQATFNTTNGTWSAPGQFVTFPEFAGFGAGTCGIAVAPGTHLALVTGEFGLNTFGVLSLPATSGSGTPAFVDYAAATLPNTPDGKTFEQGLDPHTMQVYVSPNTGKAYGVMSGASDELPPTWVAVIDLQALLSATRTSGTHTVSPSVNLLTSNIVRYVAIP